jgi:hypothetical protein
VVENASGTPSDFFRVELKTEPDTANPLRGSFQRQQQGPSDDHVQFENAQLRVTRLFVGAGERREIASSALDPAVLIPLSRARVRFSHGGLADWDPGDAHWIDGGAPYSLEGVGQSRLELLRFDLKSKPLQPPRRVSRR